MDQATENQEAQAPKKAKKEPEVTTMTMKDGRTVDFVGKRKLLKENVDHEGTPAVRLDFINGETRIVPVTIGATPENANGLLVELAQHGLKQKLGDEIAGLEDIDDGVLAIDDLIDKLKAGQFNQARQGDGQAGASILVKALVEVTQKDVDTVKAFLKDKSAAEKKALRSADGIAQVVQRLEAEKAARSKGPAVDVGALLGQLQ